MREVMKQCQHVHYLYTGDAEVAERRKIMREHQKFGDDDLRKVGRRIRTLACHTMREDERVKCRRPSRLARKLAAPPPLVIDKPKRQNR